MGSGRFSGSRCTGRSSMLDKAASAKWMQVRSGEKLGPVHATPTLREIYIYIYHMNYYALFINICEWINQINEPDHLICHKSGR